MRYGQGKPEEDDDERCTCRTPIVHSTDIDPPAYKSIRDKWCPVHGKDPDEAYDEMRERELNADLFKDAEEGYDGDHD